jgi:hypothetical protein
MEGRRMRWAGYVARVEEKRNMYRVLVGKPHSERRVARRRLVGEDGVFVDRRDVRGRVLD